MVCGPIEFDSEDAARTTITNPVLLVEVLSVTTEKGDRGNKWMHYQRISSLQEYVLVSQEVRVEIFRRTPSDTWEYYEVRQGTVRLASGPALDLAVRVAAGVRTAFGEAVKTRRAELERPFARPAPTPWH